MSLIKNVNNFTETKLQKAHSFERFYQCKNKFFVLKMESIIKSKRILPCLKAIVSGNLLILLVPTWGLNDREWEGNYLFYPRGGFEIFIFFLMKCRERKLVS